MAENDNKQDGLACDLTFKEQCQIVWDGLKKGVKYDGCTAVPDFNFGSDCCGEHDYHYQLTTVSKWEADKRLRQCIIKKGYPFIAWCYWIGLTIGGYPFYRKKQNEIFPLADDVPNPSRVRDPGREA